MASLAVGVGEAKLGELESKIKELGIRIYGLETEIDELNRSIDALEEEAAHAALEEERLPLQAKMKRLQDTLGHLRKEKVLLMEVKNLLLKTRLRPTPPLLRAEGSGARSRLAHVARVLACPRIACNFEMSYAFPPSPPPPTSSLADSALATILEEVQELRKEVEETHSLVIVLSREVASKYTYTIGKASGESRNINFRANLLQAYENGGPARCPVLGSVEPNIVAAHLFKHVWQDDVSRILHFKDIDDARNGLLLYTPIKRAFDSSQIVIIYESDSLVLHLLDRSIANDFLWEKAKQMCGSRYIQPSTATMKLKFKDLDGKALTFTTSHRPYFRCLNFHARSARRYALEKGWIRTGTSPTFGPRRTALAAC